MLKRLEWTEPCKCWGEKQYHDDEEIGIFWGFCVDCWFTDERDYFRDEDGNQFLITFKEAAERGLVGKCTKCGDIVYPNETEKGLCIVCKNQEI